MKTIEQIMKEQNREPFYDYYLSLGYAHKVAASLALFTYGAYRFDHLSIDELYDAGKNAGALGGKLLGAGGGGFLVFYVQPEKQDAVMEAMKDLLYIPFEFENSGTRVIYYAPENFEKVSG